MTQLEQYQKERIDALEKEVVRLNDQLISTKLEMKQLATRITISDPVFLSPISYGDFVITSETSQT